MVVEIFRRNIRAVRPDQSVELRMNAELPEAIELEKRFEDWSLENRSQVDFTACSVPEAEPYDVVSFVAGLEYVVVHHSLQRRDPPQRLSRASALPVLEQFRSMQVSPLQHQALSTRRKAPSYGSSLDLDGNFSVAVDGMKMRHAVFLVEHPDDNA